MPTSQYFSHVLRDSCRPSFCPNLRHQPACSVFHPHAQSLSFKPSDARSPLQVRTSKNKVAATMVRVMVLTNRIGVFSGNTGGGSAMREKLCAALTREGHDLRMFAAGHHDNADVGITDYSPMLIPSWRTLRAIWGMVRESDLLIVSGSFSPCIPFGMLAARLMGVRSLVIFTTDSDKVVHTYYTGLQRAVWWQMYSWVDRAIAALATRVYTRSGEFLTKLHRVHGIRCMGVMSQGDQYSAFQGQPDVPPEAVAKARDLLSGGQPDMPLLLYCGRWAPEKRIDVLARNKPPGTVLAIVGNGDSAGGADAVEALHDPKNGIVCLRDFVKHDQLRIYYKAADVHVSASDFETLGNSCHEALLCRTPVVLERAGGYLSQVDDGEQGFLVHWADAAQAHEAVTRGPFCRKRVPRPARERRVGCLLPCASPFATCPFWPKNACNVSARLKAEMSRGAALAFKHAVQPRKRDTVEGTDIVREMLSAPPPAILPRAPSGCASLMFWGFRMPVLVATLAIYTRWLCFLRFAGLCDLIPCLRFTNFCTRTHHVPGHLLTYAARFHCL